jgi:hypothetical protein
MSTLTAKIQLRRDTSANWTSNNPILAAGEVAFTSDVFYTSTDQQRFKIGDGVQTWTQLDYVPEGGAGYPENLFLTVVNKTTDNLLASEYKVLKVITAQGGRLAVDYALADSDANSADTIGVVYENIDNNQEGRIITIGEITGIDTTGSIQGESWSDGDPLFLSDTIDGGITNVRPTAPNHGVRLGYVVNVNANNGKIYIKIDNGYEIGEIHDVYAPSPIHNQGIFWSSGTSRYENKSIATVLGYTPENSANKGVANGYAPLASDAKVDAAYLPAYVDEVLEYANLAAFPAIGASDKIYIALDTNKVYRWSGSVYIEVAANSGVWGAITGTITNQTDLMVYLNKLPVKLSKLTDSTVVTGTTANTLIDSLLIPANTIKAGIAKVIIRNIWSTTINQKTSRIYLNTTNSLSGATLIGTFIGGSGQISIDMARNLCFKTNTSLEVYSTSTSSLSPEAQSTAARATITVNPSVDYYLIAAIQNSNTSESCINSFISFEI